jgi:hypothetical protein
VAPKESRPYFLDFSYHGRGKYRRYSSYRGYGSYHGYSFDPGNDHGRRRWESMARWISRYGSITNSTENKSPGMGNRFAVLADPAVAKRKIVVWPKADNLSEYLL